MTTERIDIVITERGARQASRNIKNIGVNAGGAATAVRALERATAILASTFGLVKLREVADDYKIIQAPLTAGHERYQRIRAGTEGGCFRRPRTPGPNSSPPPSSTNGLGSLSPSWVCSKTSLLSSPKR